MKNARARILARRRLAAQRLVGTPLASPVDAVRWRGAVQAQDFTAAKWALGQRAAATTDSAVGRLYDEGALLRTHVLRPTWHFVLPEDAAWLVALTGPRVLAGMAGRHRQLELDGGTVDRAVDAIAAALAGGRHLVRGELAEALRAAGIDPDGQRLAHLLMCAELQGVIVSGPRHGRHHSYALLEERAPLSRRIDRSEALQELALRYFRSHGPAQLQDYVWWSGLAVRDARESIALAGAALGQESIEGAMYWFDPAAPVSRRAGPQAHLLPNFDEFTVAYRDRSAALHPDRPFEPALFSFGSILSNIVTIDGRVRGSWRRIEARASMRLTVQLLHPLQPAEEAALEQAADAYARFLERPVDLVRRRDP